MINDWSAGFFSMVVHKGGDKGSNHISILFHSQIYENNIDGLSLYEKSMKNMLKQCIKYFSPPIWPFQFTFYAYGFFLPLA